MFEASVQCEEAENGIDFSIEVRDHHGRKLATERSTGLLTVKLHTKSANQHLPLTSSGFRICKPCICLLFLGLHHSGGFCRWGLSSGGSKG